MLKSLILVTILAVVFLDQASPLTPFGSLMTQNGFQGLKPLFSNHQFGFFGSESAFQVEKPLIEAEVEPLIKAIEENEHALAKLESQLKKMEEYSAAKNVEIQNLKELVLGGADF